MGVVESAFVGDAVGAVLDARALALGHHHPTIAAVDGRVWCGLLDNTALETFVEAEMTFALQLAVEAKVLRD